MFQDVMIFYKITKKRKILDVYILCNETIRNNYLFRYISHISHISIIKITSLTITWNFLLISCIWYNIGIFYTVVGNSSHNDRWHFIVKI